MSEDGTTCSVLEAYADGYCTFGGKTWCDQPAHGASCWRWARRRPKILRARAAHNHRRDRVGQGGQEAQQGL